MVNDLALQRSKYKHLSDEEWRWFLQQVEGRERTADKLPTFAAIDDWWYPVRLSCEQCSSELTARYKASLLSPLALGEGKGERFLDLTGGYGVDTFFLSEHFAHTDYVEQNAELCRIAAHNFALSQKSKVERQKLSIAVHNTTAEDFLLSSPCAGEELCSIGLPVAVRRTPPGWGLIFLDPARRDSHGGKVFKLADCTPNVVELLPALLERLAPDGRIMLKLSPMLDITQALKELSFVHRTSSLCTLSWSVHIVAVKNEVKEVLLISRNTDTSESRETATTITAIDLSRPEQAFTFTREEEKEALCPPLEGELEGVCYLFEPNAAILKAGAYKLIAQRFGLHKLDANTHLYVADTLVENFPGRVWRINDQMVNAKMVNGQMANVLTRNYPLTAEQLKKKLRLRDGGTAFVIGCRVAGKPTLFLAERL